MREFLSAALKFFFFAFFFLRLLLLCGLLFDDRLRFACLGLLGLLGLGLGQTGLQFAVLQRLDVQISVVVLAEER